MDFWCVPQFHINKIYIDIVVDIDIDIPNNQEFVKVLDMKCGCVYDRENLT